MQRGGGRGFWARAWLISTREMKKNISSLITEYLQRRVGAKRAPLIRPRRGLDDVSLIGINVGQKAYIEMGGGGFTIRDEQKLN